ncbi:alpha-hydroxy-acid oxidizing protein [Sphingomonas sp. KR1UV-12]|uniref:Alpha-hydroxy-acid oxidizing protein n=1 Tax=Sphingomonas aurea TaxID=3063994 RepID=A0ABT9EHM9_9SPHN|nr:alpha-hydroxy-acid oxidizing protein [Sphingomonas sp. KR1UV-12]MDP1026474.1 alpha-hydroxy-acid oxidizing protein [Sphingomonas sp. KR1UV-12]
MTHAVSPGPGPIRLAQAYAAGLMGQAPTVPFAVDALERAAEAAMTPQAFGYLRSAGSGTTEGANRAALDAVRLVPRMLRDVGERSLGIELFGRRLPAPLLLAPIGVQELAHADADLATARAAAARGVPMVFSNQASVAMEDCAAAMGQGPRWFQLYWTRSDDLAESLVRRAEAAGCEAIVVTLDTTMLGWRPADLDHGFLPFLKGQGIAQYTSDPVFRSMLARPPEEDMLAAAQLFTRLYSDPTLDWQRLARIREWTGLPVVLKGIQHPADAARVAGEGWDGIIVSNHGGRQVDGAVGSAAQLGRCVDAVAGRARVLFDSGIRGGADVARALALGADAVLLGRPYIWGLAAAGQAGVEAVIDNVIAELDLTMGLIGCCDVRDLGREYLA